MSSNICPSGWLSVLPDFLSLADQTISLKLKLFSKSMTGMWEMSLWMSSITPPPWVFLSFLYTLYIQVSGNSSEVVTVLSIFVSWWPQHVIGEHLEKPKVPGFCLINVYTAKCQSLNKTGLRCVRGWRFISFFPWQRFKSVLIFQFNECTEKGIRKVQNLTFWAYPWAVDVYQSSEWSCDVSVPRKEGCL